MGLFNFKSSNIKYVNVFNGIFTIPAHPNEEGAIQRVNKNDKTVWEHHHNGLIGIISKVTLRDGTFGQEWQFEILDFEKNTKYLLQTSVKSVPALGILTRLPSFDNKKPVAIVIYHYSNGDQIVIYQPTEVAKENKIEKYWSKDKPGKMPKLKDTVIDNKPAKDWTDVIQFLADIAERYNKDQESIQKEWEEKNESSSQSTGEGQATSPPPEEAGEDDTDDLPF